ncbi:hypothetical protein [Desulfofundulus sp.]|uniref:hypothetical protein n=1 Tax=Desulfofundulus sp. TaxID=2282750 RepID=UPI003C7725FC
MLKREVGRNNMEINIIATYLCPECWRWVTGREVLDEMYCPGCGEKMELVAVSCFPVGKTVWQKAAVAG